MSVSQGGSPIRHEPAQVPLAEALIALAGTPDDSSWIDSQLVAVVQLCAELATPVRHVSVTAYRVQQWRTVSASSEIAAEVDRAQYEALCGPCLEAIERQSPVAVPEIVSAVAWPQFRAAAAALGLRSSLSVPLFAGSGTPVAALNLHSDDPVAMADIAAAVCALHEPQGPDGEQTLSLPEHGTAGLIAGLAGALAVRGLIRRAVSIVNAGTPRSAGAGYVMLRLRAAETGMPLVEIAGEVISDSLGPA